MNMEPEQVLVLCTFKLKFEKEENINIKKMSMCPLLFFYIKWFRNFSLVATSISALLILKELTNLMRDYETFDIFDSTDGDGDQIYLRRKKTTSAPLIMENPVRSPMVPPMRLSWASVLIFLSLSMSSKVAVSK